MKRVERWQKAVIDLQSSRDVHHLHLRASQIRPLAMRSSFRPAGHDV